ncbi:matrix-remodeling-associated protein 7 isoform X2 [Sphaerodactylus townsendi]|uniref:matrix-remodeling-associated protein 7 isoform X2 n=1 Tax=Sphaerodactylus townsendi TaxID=933632 RepID=UPI002026A777|nr:matrix-remodeling-associated protein 7 isoform X2 [Sphaerodactylus townsendi]
MEAAVEWYFALPLLFTVLAVILASVFVKLRSSAEDKGVAERAAAAKQEGEGQPRAAETQAKAAADREEGTGGGREDGEGPPRTETGEEAKGKGERVPEEDIGTEGEEDEKKEEPREGEEDAAPRTARAEAQSHPPEMKAVAAAAAAASAFVGAAVEGEEEPEDDEDDEGEEDDEESKEEDQESETEKLVVREPESENVDEQFSFKYSPGKLRGNQYKTLLTKEELEEEQSCSRPFDFFRMSRYVSQVLGPLKTASDNSGMAIQLLY